MIDGKLDDYGWNEWRDVLLDAFEHRMVAIGVKGYQVVPVRNTIIALFLQAKGFGVPSSEILPMAIRIIRGDRVNDSGYDTIAMMGHRIGMVDNIAGLKQYLQDARKLLKPEGQVLITSLDGHAANEPRQNSYHRQNIYSERYSGVSSNPIQHKNLIGPFFCLLHIKAETLKSQAIMTTWQYEVIRWQDNDNYFARLYLA